MSDWKRRAKFDLQFGVGQSSLVEWAKVYCHAREVASVEQGMRDDGFQLVANDYIGAGHSYLMGCREVRAVPVETPLLSDRDRAVQSLSERSSRTRRGTIYSLCVPGDDWWDELSHLLAAAGAYFHYEFTRGGPAGSVSVQVFLPEDDS